MPGGRDRQGESFSGGNPDAPSEGREGGADRTREGGADRTRGRGPLDFRKKKKTLATDDVSPEPNIGNVSGLGGKRDVTGLGIMQRRRARGASLINLVPTLADTTRRALFGI